MLNFLKSIRVKFFICIINLLESVKIPSRVELAGPLHLYFFQRSKLCRRYLSEPIPDDNFAEMHYDEERGVWVAEIELDTHAEQIDFFSNYLSRVKHNGRAYETYLSSPYTRVVLPKR